MHRRLGGFKKIIGTGTSDGGTPNPRSGYRRRHFLSRRLQSLCGNHEPHKAGFTGTRCGYIVLPKAVKGYTKDGKEQALNPLWNRRHTTKFNGTPYIIQRGAEAVLTEEGQKQVKEMVGYYMENAKIIREGLASLGLTVFGGVNSPYVWLKVPAGMTSWDFFDKLLHEANIVGTPGSGFGPSGENYICKFSRFCRKPGAKCMNRRPAIGHVHSLESE